MSAILTIDKGNTATKVKVFTDIDRADYVQVFERLSPENLALIIENFNVQSAALCSVGKHDVQLLGALKNRFDDKFLHLTHHISVPVKVNYNTPETLGADRVAAVCGAVTLIPNAPLLIADAGTALTLDCVDENGCFIGGNISAGISLRLKSLHQFTAALPSVDAQGDLPEFGYDTPTALRSGAVRGVAAEINAAYSYALNRQPNTKLIITGGDAPMLLPLLNTETVCHPDLVSLGLISIMKHNELI
ncbi:MAG: type III pantothenate kinase [Prevotella sp.]|nr:type III pantothenate kinase [Prevotella sp.]MCM1075709.1 type III pantothenate kinase [Ruminococcus sp.]